MDLFQEFTAEGAAWFANRVGPYIAALTEYYLAETENSWEPDHSTASMEKIEAFYLDKVLRGGLHEAIKPEIDKWLAAYLGETLRHRMGGGKWNVFDDAEKQAFFGLPGVFDLPGLPGTYGWCPYIPILDLSKKPEEGIFEAAMAYHMNWRKDIQHIPPPPQSSYHAGKK